MTVAGKPSRGQGAGGREPYSAAVRAHAETVLRGFYDFHLEAGCGPMVNPFPLDRSRRGGRAHAHHNPMDPFRNERAGLYRPTLPSRIPRSIPDAEFNEVFARLPSQPGPGAGRVLRVDRGAGVGAAVGRAGGVRSRPAADHGDRGRGRGGCRSCPASADAFVWLRLYQAETDGLIPGGRAAAVVDAAPACRPLTYHAVHRMFERAGAAARGHR